MNPAPNRVHGGALPMKLAEELLQHEQILGTHRILGRRQERSTLGDFRIERHKFVGELCPLDDRLCERLLLACDVGIFAGNPCRQILDPVGSQFRYRLQLTLKLPIGHVEMCGRQSEVLIEFDLQIAGPNLLP
jgi:hypothetical protein